MLRRPGPNRVRAARFLALLIAAGVVGVAVPLLLGAGLHRVVVAVVGGAPAPADARGAQPRIGTVQLSSLPDEAQRTIELVLRGGPFPYRRDGVVFENRERRLPSRPRGYYREYTVPTPGQHDRGPRRIVFGGGKEFYYSDDHYRSFRRVEGIR